MVGRETNCLIELVVRHALGIATSAILQTVRPEVVLRRLGSIEGDRTGSLCAVTLLSSPTQRSPARRRQRAKAEWRPATRSLTDWPQRRRP